MNSRSTATAGVELAGATVFVPSVGRFLLTELWSHLLSVAGGSVLLYFLGTWSWETVAIAAGVGLLFVAFGATFMRQSRRLAFGETFVTGPTRGSTEATTIPLSTLDVANSGFRKGRFVVQARNGQRITARMAWYSADAVEEIRRLARERCGIMALPDEGV